MSWEIFHPTVLVAHMKQLHIELNIPRVVLLVVCLSVRLLLLLVVALVVISEQSDMVHAGPPVNSDSQTRNACSCLTLSSVPGAHFLLTTVEQFVGKTVNHS